MNYFTDTFPIPFGVFSVAVDDTGALVATAFGDVEVLKTRLNHDAELTPDTKKTAAVRQQVREYFAGKRRTFDVTLAAQGTAFQQRVWKALCAVPFGETRSYGKVASRIGKPTASRAVGRANGSNPICLIVPCHRVIGSDGSLTGFAFGEDIKRRLLEHERNVAA